MSMDIRKFVRDELKSIVAESEYSGYNNSTYKERMKEFTDSLVSFDVIDDEKIKKIIYFFAYEGFNSEEEAYDELRDKVEEWKKMPNPVKLYRVVGLTSEGDIDLDRLGEHWTQYDWLLDGDMLMSIGSENWEDDMEPYVVEAMVPLSEIDIPQTIIQNLSFPNEHEINLKNHGRGAKFLKMYPLD